MSTNDKSYKKSINELLLFNYVMCAKYCCPTLIKGQSFIFLIKSCTILLKKKPAKQQKYHHKYYLLKGNTKLHFIMNFYCGMISFITDKYNKGSFIKNSTSPLF